MGCCQWNLSIGLGSFPAVCYRSGVKVISFNAPVTLIITLGAVAEMATASILGVGTSNWVTYAFFASPGHLPFLNPLDYLRMFSYVFGHANWDHCLGNVLLLLILGPLIEEKYGSMEIAVLCLVTAVGTALVNCFLGLSLIGASGIVFLFIILSSFGSSKGSKLPLTMLLVAVLYIGREVIAGFEPNPNNISHMGHIIGGMFGLVYGLMHNMIPEAPGEPKPLTGLPPNPGVPINKVGSGLGTGV